MTDTEPEDKELIDPDKVNQILTYVKKQAKVSKDGMEESQEE